VWRGDRWDGAEADAPWHRYTRLRLNIADSYQRARLDWWFLDFVPRFAATGRALLGLMVLGMMAALAGWWRAARAGPAAA
jgi:hypothetical protein